MIQPKISVVTVCYNAVNDIEKTILSVINQTYPNVEYLIIDGGSTDGTMDVVNKYKDKIDVIVSEPDKGIYDAMNKGIDRATGEWINFMNAGDCFVGTTVICDVVANCNKNTVAVYGDMFFVTNTQKKYFKSNAISFIKKNMPCSHQALFCRMKDVKELRFDTDYKIAADYNMLYHLFWKNGKDNIERLDFPIVLFDGTGLSSCNKIKTFREVLKIRSAHKDCFYYWDYFKDCIKKVLRLKY